MRPTSLKLLQILPRSVLGKKAAVIPPLPTVIKASQSKPPPTVVEQLLARQQAPESAQSWPSNLRIEPVVKKADLKNVHADIRTKLKELISKET
ncbi:hypothetical protein V5O48_011787 [Marasmius crinis-equi]|uniref:Uncharacterized protein n=1 Tax=Marasmius crinis-equi TaxID=585013 RepID=A0ABR3F4K3_9AGAR